MCEIQDYLKSINPEETNDTHPLFYGAKYNCYIKDEFIGVFTWTQDENVGDSFQNLIINDTNEICAEVAIPDKWILLPNSEQNTN